MGDFCNSQTHTYIHSLLKMQLKMYFYLFSFYYFVIGVQSLDLNENSDEIEIFKHLFAKLNKLLDGNDSVQKDLSKIKNSIQHLEDKLNENAAASKPPDLNNDELLSCSSIASPDNYCFGNDWIVIQRRTDGSEDFYRDWNDYKLGFGNKSNEFFAGLEKIHQITIANSNELLIIMQDYDNSKRYAKYDNFEIGSEEQEYVLKTLGSYSGNAGDSLTYHKGSKFSTKDRDNDLHSSFNCAERFQSAWWFKACFESNLNGCYNDANSRDPTSAVACGVHWKTFRGQWYSLKFVEIMIRRKV